MSDRLSPLDVSFLYMEESTTAMHVGGVAIFRVPDAGFDYDRLVELISSRIAFVPRYRQRIRTVPGRLANPVWVDDEHFDVTFHVRRSALPDRATTEQLHELVARLMSRSLDRNRPLWEIYLVEGLSDDRFAVITKTHHAMVDGVSAIDIGQIMLDVEPTPRPTPPDTVAPAPPEPSWLELVAGAISDAVRRPTAGPRHAADGCERPSADDRTRAGRGRRPALRRQRGRAAGTEQPTQRVDHQSAQVRDRAHRPRRLQADPQVPRRHGQRRGAGDGDRCAAHLAARPWRDPVLRGDRPRHGSGQRAATEPPARLPSATRSRRTSSTCRWASPMPSCACTR